MKLKSVDSFVSHHKCSPMEYSQRSELHEIKIFLAIKFDFVIFCELLRTVYIAEIVLYFVHFGSFEFNTNVRLSSFCEIRNLNKLILIIDDELKKFDDSP